MDWPLAITVTSFLTGTLVVLGVWQRRVVRAQERHFEQHSQEGRGHGEGHPVAQHPQVNPYRCLGCGCCVRACPEHGALAVVRGRACLVHTSRCIGHGYCEQACPIGALTVGLGDTSHRSDLPILTPELETSVPGVFMAGELGGIALIRHAIEQGSRVVETILRRMQDEGVTPGGDDPADILIVGCGPAGISAALKATERGLSCAVIEQNDVGGTVRKYPRNKLTMTQPVDLPLFGRMRRTQYTKEELIRLWETIFSKTGIEVQAGITFTGLEQTSDGTFRAETSEGTLSCRYVILALGRRGTPRRLGVPGEESEKVLYELMDAADHHDEDILVVGGGDSAIEAVIALEAQTGNRVTLSYRRDGFFRLKEQNRRRIMTLQNEGRVDILLNSQVTRIEEGSATVDVREGDESRTVTVAADYVFILAGGAPPYPFLKGLGIRFGGEAEAASDRRAESTEARR
ncbi:MAG: NAD(P)-binding domain-containing protein [Phycisphaerales bacterium]|nr:MAG: NAD(P)-binding domain-containing protein [Phycisphaerales bacterium]